MMSKYEDRPVAETSVKRTSTAMRSLGLSSYAIGSTVMMFLLAGCGALQPPIGGVSVAAQSPKAFQHAPPVSQSDLLYVVTTDVVDVLSYPEDKIVKKINGYGGIAATDPNNGNVCFDSGTTATEFAHGGSQPIGVIRLPYGFYPFDCAFDPSTDDIAITVDTVGAPGGYVAVYQTPTSSPTTYSLPTGMRKASYLGYDSLGDLFIDGSGKTSAYVLAELPKGGLTFTNVTLNPQLKQMWAIQWDGTYITVAGPHVISRLQISGSGGTIVGTTTLSGACADDKGSLWIQGAVVIGPHVSPRHNGRYLGFWNYPAGGAAFQVLSTLSRGRKILINSEAVSVAPSGMRVRK
jgi:hypothetical protein